MVAIARVSHFGDCNQAINLAGAPTVWYMSDYRDFDGIQIPLNHRIYSRNEDGNYQSTPVLLTIDIDRVVFS